MTQTLNSFLTTALDSPHNRPIYVVHIEGILSSALLLCDRKFGSGSSAFKIGASVYFPVITGWGDIDTGPIDVFNRRFEVSSASFTVQNTISLFGYRNFYDLIRDEYPNSIVSIYVTFEGASSSDDLLLRFKGVMEQPTLEGTLVNVDCVGIESTILEKFAPEVCSIDSYPDSDPDDIGKIFPIAFGRPKKVPFLAVDAGTMDNLSAAITATDTSITVSDSIGFPENGATIQIDEEKITYTGITGTTFTGCSRGVSGTTAVAHNQGAVVAEIQTEYVYVIGHPVKAFDGVYVQHRKTGEQVLQDPSKYTLYTGQSGNEHDDYPGKAVIVFDVLPSITEQINIEAIDTIDVDDTTGVGDGGHEHEGDAKYTTWNFDFAVATDYVYGESPLEGHNASALADGNLGTYAGLKNDGNTATAQRVQLQNMDGIPTQVRVCLMVGFVDGYCGATFTFLGKSISYSDNTGESKWVGAVVTSSWFDLSEVQQDWDYIQAQTGTVVRTGSTNPAGYTFVGEAWAEFITIPTTGVGDANVSKTGTVTKTGTVELVGNSVADTVIGGRVSADLQGWQADNSGLFGTSGTVIDRADLIMKKFLMEYCNLSSAYIGESYTQAAIDFSIYGGVVSPVLLERKNAIEFLNQIAFESRSIQYFESGKHQIKFLLNSAVDKVISEDRIVVNSLKVSYPPRSEIINTISAQYNRYWVETYEKEKNESVKSVVSGESTSSISKYGVMGADPLYLDFINGEILATIFLEWFLGESSFTPLSIQFDCLSYGEDLQKGDIIQIDFDWGSYFGIVSSGRFITSTKFRVMGITKSIERVTIQARECTTPIGLLGTEIFQRFPVLASGDDGTITDGSSFSSTEIAEYVRPASRGSVKESFIRFNNIAIPQGYSITKAVFVGSSITAKSKVGALGTIINYFVDADDANAPTNVSEYNALSLTSGIEIGSFFSESDTSVAKSESVHTELQKIIDRPGWVSDNAVVAVWKNGSIDGDPLNSDIRSYNGGGSYPLYSFYNFSVSGDGKVIFSPLECSYPRKTDKYPFIYISVDGGRSFTKKSMGIYEDHKDSVNTSSASCCNHNGTIIYNQRQYGIYKSVDYGSSWEKVYDYGSEYPSVAGHKAISCSESGEIVFFKNSASPYKLCLSTNYGATFSIIDVDAYDGHKHPFCNTDGSLLVVSRDRGYGNPPYISYSDDLGDSWSSADITVSGTNPWFAYDLCCSNDGETIAVHEYYDYVWYTFDMGSTWKKKKVSSGYIYGISVSFDGEKLNIVRKASDISYLEKWVKSGGNFISVSSVVIANAVFGSNGCWWLEESKNGSVMATSERANIYSSFLVSRDSGSTWVSAITDFGTSNFVLEITHLVPWLNLTTSKYWQAYGEGVLFEGSTWEFNSTAGANGGKIKTVGNWAVGFRPSKLKITHSRVATDTNVFVYSSGGMLGAAYNYTSGSDISLSFINRSDISYIEFAVPEGETNTFTVTAIDFYTGEFSTSGTTTTTTSTSTTATTTISSATTNTISTTTSSHSTTTTTRSGWTSSSSTTTTTTTSSTASTVSTSSSTASTVSTISTISTTSSTSPPVTVDLCTYTERDDLDWIEVSTGCDKVTFALAELSNCCLQKNYGANYFTGDFNHSFKLYVDPDLADSGSFGGLFALSNVAFTQYLQLADPDEYGLVVSVEGASTAGRVEIHIRDTYLRSWAKTDEIVLFNNNPVWVSVRRVGSNASVLVYGNSGMTNLLSSATISCTTRAYKYHTTAFGQGTISWNTIGGYVEDLEFS